MACILGTGSGRRRAWLANAHTPRDAAARCAYHRAMHPQRMRTTTRRAAWRMIVAAAALAAGPAHTMPTLPRPLDAVVAAALADAARRSGLPATALRVVAAEAVTWPDGSLGCPLPGMFYTQALVPGYRVRVRAGDQVLDYHAGRGGAPQWCPPDRAQEPLADDPRR